MRFIFQNFGCCKTTCEILNKEKSKKKSTYGCSLT